MAFRKPKTKDYYGVLGVPPDSDSTEIKKAYRALVQQFHPDRVQGKDEVTNASERMIEINEAFAVLADTKRRAQFDRELASDKAPSKPAEPEVENWEMPLAPGREKVRPTRRNVAVEQSVAQEFLDKAKAQLLQDGAAIKFKEEGEQPWRWSLLGKTWGANYWVGVRSVSLLNPNTAREMLTQAQSLIEKRKSAWKNNFFVFLFGFDSLHESETVLKMIRTFTNREENSAAKNLVNIVVVDLNQRRMVLCGKRSADLNYAAVLHALGIS
jgi:curved DNA-binding protein CbpA